MHPAVGRSLRMERQHHLDPKSLEREINCNPQHSDALLIVILCLFLCVKYAYIKHTECLQVSVFKAWQDQDPRHSTTTLCPCREGGDARAVHGSSLEPTMLGIGLFFTDRPRV